MSSTRSCSTPGRNSPPGSRRPAAELVLGRELRSAARAWDVDGRNDDDLYRGARLVAGDEFISRHTDVNPVITEFIAAGKPSPNGPPRSGPASRARVNRRLRASSQPPRCCS